MRKAQKNVLIDIQRLAIYALIACIFLIQMASVSLAEVTLLPGQGTVLIKHQAGSIAGYPIYVKYRPSEMESAAGRHWVSSLDIFLRKDKSIPLAIVQADSELFVFEEVASEEEAGLMGITLHPQYEENRYVYACYAAASGEEIIDRVVRLVDKGDSLAFDRIIVDDIPAAKYHSGCRIRFGPDGMLYITTGDALQKEQAQDLDSLAGKILRVDAEGNIPADNPFPGSAVYSYGHRNPQGIDWDPESGQMFSSEHGPSGFDGPGGGDEINLIEAGGNYGWPLVSHDGVLEGTIAPLIQFTPAEAPASAFFYTSKVMPFFTGNLFFGALRGEGVMRVVVVEDENENITVEYTEKIISDVGRVRDISAGPDGSIYFTTSNRDGRGQEREGDDHLYRIYPVFD